MDDNPNLTTAQREFLSRTPERFRRMYVEAVTCNRRQLAIRTFCVQCTGWTPSETRECTGCGCPLWPYRMGGHPGAEAATDGSDEATRSPGRPLESPEAPRIDAESDPTPEPRFSPSAP